MNMKKMLDCSSLPLPRQRGAILPLAVAAMTAIVGLTGVGIDIGFIVWNKRQLHAAVEAAALAGAQDLLGTYADEAAATQRITETVNNYAARYAQGSGGGGGGQKVSGSDRWYNALALSTNVTVNPPNVDLRNLGKSQVGLDPGAQSKANALRVTQTAIIRPFFMSLFGLNSITISARAAASAGGGSGAPPVNVAVVTDTTGSMQSSTVNCGKYGSVSALRCSKYGMFSLISQLTTAGNTVGLTVFPPRDSASVLSKDLDCNKNNISSSDTALYMAGNYPDYWRDTGTSISTIIDWSYSSGTNGYYQNGALNTSNSLIQAIGRSESDINRDCGIDVGAGKSTYYAQAIRQAQANFARLNNGQQNIMIVLTDGDANSDDFAAEAQLVGTIYDGEDASVNGRISGFARFVGRIGGNRTTAYSTPSDRGRTLRVSSVTFGTLEMTSDDTITAENYSTYIDRMSPSNNCHDTGSVTTTRDDRRCTGTGGTGTYRVRDSTQIATDTVFTQVTAGYTLTVDSVRSGHVKLMLGEVISGSGITSNTKIIGDKTNGATCPTATSPTAPCTGEGAGGTYLVDKPHRMTSNVTITTSRRSGRTLRVSSMVKGRLAIGNTVERTSSPSVNSAISAMATSSGCVNADTACTGTGDNGSSSEPATYRLSNSYLIESPTTLYVFGNTHELQCQQAIVAANEAKAAGTQVYVIGYGPYTSQGCSTDGTATLSGLNLRGERARPCNTLQWMAGDKGTQVTTRPDAVSKFFYSTSSSCASPNSYADINTLFEEIAEGITNVGSRTIPDDAW